MAERIVLTEPEAPKVPGATFYEPVRLILDLGVQPSPVDGSLVVEPQYAHITATLRGDNGVGRVEKIAMGPEAVELINALNTANLTQKSLRTHILERVVQNEENDIDGTVQNV